MLTRRSYMFTVVAFYLLYGVWVLARAARRQTGQCGPAFCEICCGIAGLRRRAAAAHVLAHRPRRLQRPLRHLPDWRLLAELNNQRVYLGWLVFAIMLVGILYGLYKSKARSLAVLSAVGAVLTVLLVTRVQNMDDHQSLAVAPFYLLGCFLCALLIANLPWAWPAAP